MTAETVVDIIGPHPDVEMMERVLQKWKNSR